MNHYRDALSGMFKRALRLELVERNRVNGRSRPVPMNSLVSRLFVDLATRRGRPELSQGPVFSGLPRDASKFFSAAVRRAQAALRANGMDASGLDGVTWHSCRHTFASRLVMAGVDLRTGQELGGWRTLALVTRYVHMQPDHLKAAVESLVQRPGAVGARAEALWNLDLTWTSQNTRRVLRGTESCKILNWLRGGVAEPG